MGTFDIPDFFQWAFMTGGKGVESINCQDYMLKKMTFQSLVSLAMLPGDNFLKKCQIANLALGITQIGENQVCGDIQKACKRKTVIFGKGSAGQHVNLRCSMMTSQRSMYGSARKSKTGSDFADQISDAMSRMRQSLVTG